MMLKLFGSFSSKAGYKQGWGIIIAENFEISKVGSLKRMYNGVIFNSKYVLSLSYKTFQTVLYIKLVLLLEKKKIT